MASLRELVRQGGRWFANRNPVPTPQPFQEMGVSGTAVYGGYVQVKERSADWIGWRKWQTIADLSVNISIVAAGVHYFCNLVAYPEWTVRPSDDKDEESVLLAKFMDDVLKKLETPFYKVVRRATMYRFHGFGVQEWTAKKRDDGFIGLDDIETRPQHTIEQWDVDELGTVRGVWQRAPQTGALLGIPRSKVLYLVEDTLTDNPEGVGMFRHMADTYNRLKQLQQLEIRAYERDMRGIPIARMPIAKIQEAVKTNTLTQAQADKMISDMRSMTELQVKQSDTGLILDSSQYVSVSSDGFSISSAPMWNFELLSGGGVGHQEIAAAIDRVQREIARIIGVEHLMMGDTGGNRALSEDKSRNLYLIANSVLKYIADQAQHDLINPIWALNGFDWSKRPTFEVEDVTFKNADAITSALSKMAQAGAVLAPNDPAINDVRDLLGIERVPKEMLEQAAQQQKQQQDAQNILSKLPPGARMKGPQAGGGFPKGQGQGMPKPGFPGGPRPPGTTQAGGTRGFGAKKRKDEVRKAGFDPSQPRNEKGEWTSAERDMQTGGWSGGPGGLSGSDTASLQQELERRLPGHSIDITPFAGGHEVTIHQASDDPRLHRLVEQVGEFFVPIQKGSISFESIYTTNDAMGRQFARNFLSVLHDIAVQSQSTGINLTAVGSGAYVWPHIGFELNPSPAAVRDFVSSIQGRLDAARSVLSSSDWGQLNDTVKAGGLDLPYRLSNFNNPLTADQAARISRNESFITDAALRRGTTYTLGKALLVGSTAQYRLPSSKYGMLKAWTSR